MRRFEPPAPVFIDRVALPESEHELLVLRADASHQRRPLRSMDVHLSAWAPRPQSCRSAGDGSKWGPLLGSVDCNCNLFVGPGFTETRFRAKNARFLGWCGPQSPSKHRYSRQRSRLRILNPQNIRRTELSDSPMAMLGTPCSRRELDVSFWVISWHPMTDVGTRNVLETQVGP